MYCPAVCPDISILSAIPAIPKCMPCHKSDLSQQLILITGRAALPLNLGIRLSWFVSRAQNCLSLALFVNSRLPWPNRMQSEAFRVTVG